MVAPGGVRDEDEGLVHEAGDEGRGDAQRARAGERLHGRDALLLERDAVLAEERLASQVAVRLAAALGEVLLRARTAERKEPSARKYFLQCLHSENARVRLQALLPCRHAMQLMILQRRVYNESQSTLHFQRWEKEVSRVIKQKVADLVKRLVGEDGLLRKAHTLEDQGLALVRAVRADADVDLHRRTPGTRCVRGDVERTGREKPNGRKKTSERNEKTDAQALPTLRGSLSALKRMDMPRMGSMGATVTLPQCEAQGVGIRLEPVTEPHVGDE